ncbi:MAG TPA: hypothetical protein VMZ90_00815 [Vicinamibacterales bacterium]|nr:hypothetical protein [Vicinamibacterales bacterium]
MPRHERCATPLSSIDSTMAARWDASTSFEATMPMTPRCQPSPATTITVREPRPNPTRVPARELWRDVAALSQRFCTPVRRSPAI